MSQVMGSAAAAGSPLVGRVAEVAALKRAVGLEGDGRPPGGNALVVGDAGVGKTRLLSVLADAATRAGWRVLVGHCLDFGDSEVPYLPFSEAFGWLAGRSPGLVETLVAAHPGIEPLLPGRAPDIARRFERAELFDAVHAALGALAAEAPLLLVVEDVHWADQSTRDMLTLLLSRPFPTPVALVASYRGDDLHRRHPLRAVASQWARLPAVTRIHVPPLQEDDLRALIRALQPAPLKEREVLDIVERSQGIPFFAEELLAATGSGAGSLPADLADLLLVRLDQLDEPGRQVVRAVAAAGRRVTHDLLARVVLLPAEELEGALRSAVEHNVLVPVGDSGYQFRHALLAEAVDGDLLPGERVRLHRAYTEALRTSEQAADLARHARAAHDVATAVRASIAAGDQAMARSGPDEAARHYEVALGLLADDRGELGAEVDAVALTVKASEAATASGNPHRGARLVEDQLRLLPADAPPMQRAQLLAALATAALLTETRIDLLEVTSQALAMLPEHPPSALRAQLTGMQARVYADIYRTEDAARWAREALAMGRELGLADVVAHATTTLARLEGLADDRAAVRRSLERGVAEARAAGAIEAELRGQYNLGNLDFEAGELASARALLESTAHRARETGRPWAPYGLGARALAAFVAYVAGDWDDALRMVDVTGESPPGIAEATLAATGLTVAAGRGEEQAIALLQQLRPWWERDGLIAITGGGAAIDLHGDSGDLDAAEEAWRDVTACLSGLWRMDAFPGRLRLSALLLGHLADEAALAGARDLDGLADRGAAAATSAAPAFTGTEGPEGQAWHARLLAEGARLRWLTGVDPPSDGDLVAVWEQAVVAFERFGHVFETARSQARLAAVLRAVGRPAEAHAVAAAASDAATRLGAKPLLRELERLGERPARAAANNASRELTGRELEVLTLVALGRSNREIGRQLFISAKTASVHVSHILAKLGATGRTEAAAMARRRGLLDDGTG